VKHPDGRVAGQQAAGLNAVTLELLQNLIRPRAARQDFAVGMFDRTFAGARWGGESLE